MSGSKAYTVEGLAFEFKPNGSPFAGVLSATVPDAGTYTAEVNLTKTRSRKDYVQAAAEIYEVDEEQLLRALNEICTLRIEEVDAAAREAAPDEDEERVEDLPEEAEELISSPGVLDRFVEHAAGISGVVGDRDPLRVQALVALGAQLAPLAGGKLAGANLILTAEPGRGKNFICDAVAALLPEEFYLAFESASAKALYYRAENDPEVIKHHWLYPNEAEATDQLVKMLRPLLSGGRAVHLTVNNNAEGRNEAQELALEGPVAITIPTVRNKLDAQLQTRLLVAELADYEGRVAAHSRAVSRRLLPDNAGEDHTPRIEAWRAALRSLTKARRVVFPLDRQEFCFDSNEVSHGARLWANVLGLMLAHAWLEQRNREVMDLHNGERAIVATPEDYEVAYSVFKATCERSVVNLSDTHRAILDAVYELSAQSSFDGFSLRKIADKAQVHHSTIAEHKTYLTRSVKLLRETEGGLDLVSGADPSWWRKNDLLVGFPRPEQVRRWWEEAHPAPESARQARHPSEKAQNPDTYAEKSVGDPARQRPDATRQAGEEPLSGGQTGTSGEEPDSEKPIDKGKTDRSETVSGVSGGSERGEVPLSFDLGSGQSETVSELEERREIAAAIQRLFEMHPEARQQTPEQIADDLYVFAGLDYEPEVSRVEALLKEATA